MWRDDDFRDLMFADVALRRGVADSKTIAAALQRVWEGHGSKDLHVASELRRRARVADSTIDSIHAEVDACVARAGGSPQRALTQIGGLDPRLRSRLPRDAAAATRVPTQLPGSADGAQREGGERYVDFIPMGQGGMGIVYWALDTEMRRQVAFKVVRPPVAGGGPDVTPPLPGAVSAPPEGSREREAFEELEARFLQEARVTGGLEHPGIAPVYELGRTDEGVPYYTMRFIAGNRTLTDAIREAADRDLESRLGLLDPYLRICDTIRYAHDRGVIHRDLKPDNVALGEYGEVVVLDWGLAKLRSQEVEATSGYASDVSALSPAGDFKTVASSVGTPGYMAPEAAGGQIEAIDERTDVWSLGVVLYQVLTGRRPIEFKTSEEYTARVLSEVPRDPRAVAPDVPAALAELCVRMLACEQRERPDDVDEVATTIRRWQAQRAVDREVETLLREADLDLDTAADLEGEQLLRRLDRATAALRRVRTLDAENEDAHAGIARAAGLRERGIAERERGARRQVLRRAGAIGLAAALVVGVVVIWMLEERRQDAEDAREDAEDVMGFMVGDLQRRLEPIGRLDVLSAIGERSKAYYESLPIEDASPGALKNRTQLWLNLGDVHEARGDLSKAIDAYRRAQNVARRFAAARPDDPDAKFLPSVAEARAGRALFDQGHRKDAMPIFARHTASMKALVAAQPGNEAYRGALVKAHVSSGLAHVARSRWTEALAALEDARAEAQSLANRAEDPTAWRRDMLEVDLTTARILGTRSRHDQAIERAKAVVSEARTLRETYIGDLRWIEAEATAYVTLGATESQMGNAMDDEAWMRAGAAYDAALRNARSLHLSDPLNMRWAAQLAEVQRRRSSALGRQDDVEGVRTALREATDLLQALTKRDPSNAVWRHDLATLCDRLTAVSESGDDVIRLRTLALEQAGWLREKDPEDDDIAHLHCYALSRLAVALMHSNRDRAIALYREAIGASRPLLRRDPGNDDLAVLASWNARELALMLPGPAHRTERVRLQREAAAALARTDLVAPGVTQVLNSAVRVNAYLAAELADGDEAQRAEAVKAYARARALRGTLEKRAAMPAAYLVSLRDDLERARKALVAAGIPVPTGEEDGD